MCRGRNRVENRVGEVEARGGAGWGGVVTYFADRIVLCYTSCSLAPEIVCVCVRVSVCKYPFLQLCSLYSLHRGVLRKRILRQYMYKNLHIMVEVRFDGAYGLCGVRVASVINSGIKCAINKCSSKCFSYFYYNTTVHD